MESDGVCAIAAFGALIAFSHSSIVIRHSSKAVTPLHCVTAVQNANYSRKRKRPQTFGNSPTREQRQTQRAANL
jgi:hypothetical protein